jgi:hypothetical protein
MARSIFRNGAAGAANSIHELVIVDKACADNTATDLISISIPNSNQSAVLIVELLGSSGGTDAYESSRFAQGAIVIARTTGANAVLAAATLELAQIATVSGGDTFTLAYGVSAVSGAVGAVNTATVQVTLNSVGNQALTCMAFARIINKVGSGITISAS